MCWRFGGALFGKAWELFKEESRAPVDGSSYLDPETPSLALLVLEVTGFPPSPSWDLEGYSI